MKFSRIVVVSMAILVFSSGVSLASTFYVATNGDDARSCSTAQNIATPKRTIPSGFGCIAPGDTLLIRGGTYPGINSNNTIIPTGSSWSNAPIISAYPGETVTLNSGSNLAAPSDRGQSEIKYVIFDGIRFQASGGDALSFWGVAHHIRIQNCEAFGSWGNLSGINMQNGPAGGGSNEIINCKVHDNGDMSAGSTSGMVGHGLYIATSNNLFDRLEVYNNAHYGMQIYCSGCSPSGNIIRNSVFRNNGLYLEGAGFTIHGTNNQAYNNVSYGNQYGISASGSGHKVHNNTVYGNSTVGLQFQGTSHVVKNNIIYNNSSLINDYSSGITLSNNLTSDPQFVDVANGNFALRSSSPAINAGQALAEVTTDINGVSRPQGGAYDIGAFEYGGTTQTLPPPSNLMVQQ